MTTQALPHVAPTPATRARVRRALAAWHESVRIEGPADVWDANLIDRVIAALAAQGRPFSSNDMRDLLPEVRKCLIGTRLAAAQRNGQIRKCGYTPSTLPSTKGHPVAVYEPVPLADTA